MKKKKITAISTRTDAEWPPDHPGRNRAVILSPRQIEKVNAVLVCTLVGETRTTPPEDDADVEGRCTRCGVPVMSRASAPDIPKVCWICFKAM